MLIVCESCANYNTCLMHWCSVCLNHEEGFHPSECCWYRNLLPTPQINTIFMGTVSHSSLSPSPSLETRTMSKTSSGSLHLKWSDQLMIQHNTGLDEIRSRLVMFLPRYLFQCQQTPTGKWNINNLLKGLEVQLFLVFLVIHVHPIKERNQEFTY